MAHAQTILGSDGTEVWQHVRTGGLYTVVAKDEVWIEADLTPAVVYRCLGSGATWVRPRAEFMDGRFRRIDGDVLADMAATAQLAHGDTGEAV